MKSQTKINRLSDKVLMKIADSKGLRLEYDQVNGYVLYDKYSGQCLMTYATITIDLMTSDHTWREECNKLKRDR